MSKLLLSGHTGSINHGCEAIVRSTIEIFSKFNVSDITLFTHNKEDDRAVDLDLICEVIPYKNYRRYNVRKIYSKFLLKIFGNYVLDQKLLQSVMIEKIGSGDILFEIGGDTYCYTRPIEAYASNKFAKKKGATTILWACSLEKELIDNEMLADLKRYDYICPREQITYNTLIEKGIPKNKIITVSDPAFNLVPKKTVYPKIMNNGNTLGLNVSPIIYRNKDAYNAVLNTIEYVLQNTDMNIVLIPHVYKKGTIDSEVLNDIYIRFQDSGRVDIIDSELSCSELKYVISKCKLFIGARTHSTIAAYSSGVPTIVLGYSVKSRGIAMDLFGKEENFVLMVDQLARENKLIEAFDFLYKNQDDIKTMLEKKMPEYKQLSIDAVEKIANIGNLSKHKKIYHNKGNCSGCTACVSVCPKKCIEMKCDMEGFLYPETDDSKCVHCGACDRACHYKNQLIKKQSTHVYAAINKDANILVTSSSGGVFYSLARVVINRGGVVFGAAFDQNFNVVHKAVNSIEDISLLQGSKYVQSNMGNSFSEVKKILELGKEVLFTGTPCQISGLLSFLNKDYDNLLTMDFICHGVPSPLVWRKYLDEMIEKYNSPIKSINFRSKEYGWKLFSIKIEFLNGDKYIGKITEDPYLRSFISDIHLRKSCNNCAAKGVERPADITVADFWGIDKICKQMNDDKGTSIIITRGQKAQVALSKISDELTLFDSDIDTVIKFNPSITKSVSPNRLRDSFFKVLKKKSFSKAYDNYCSLKLIAKIHRKLGK